MICLIITIFIWFFVFCFFVFVFVSLFLLDTIMPKIPSKNFDETWKELRPVLERLLRQEAVNHKEWHCLFGDVHNLCLWDEQMQNAKRLQEELQSDIKAYIHKSSEVLVSIQYCFLIPELRKVLTYLVIKLYLFCSKHVKKNSADDTALLHAYIRHANALYALCCSLS